MSILDWAAILVIGAFQAGLFNLLGILVLGWVACCVLAEIRG